MHKMCKYASELHSSPPEDVCEKGAAEMIYEKEGISRK